VQVEALPYVLGGHLHALTSVAPAHCRSSIGYQAGGQAALRPAVCVATVQPDSCTLTIAM
jgi:hypothetical protein